MLTVATIPGVRALQIATDNGINSEPAPNVMASKNSGATGRDKGPSHHQMAHAISTINNRVPNIDLSPGFKFRDR